MTKNPKFRPKIVPMSALVSSRPPVRPDEPCQGEATVQNSASLELICTANCLFESPKIPEISAISIAPVISQCLAPQEKCPNTTDFIRCLCGEKSNVVNSVVKSPLKNNGFYPLSMNVLLTTLFTTTLFYT